MGELRSFHVGKDSVAFERYLHEHYVSKLQYRFSKEREYVGLTGSRVESQEVGLLG